MRVYGQLRDLESAELHLIDTHLDEHCDLTAAMESITAAFVARVPDSRQRTERQATVPGLYFIAHLSMFIFGVLKPLFFSVLF